MSLDPWNDFAGATWRRFTLPDVPVLVSEILTFPVFPSRRSWGEAWWTARDLCITNLKEPYAGTKIEPLLNEVSHRLNRLLLLGEESSG